MKRGTRLWVLPLLLLTACATGAPEPVPARQPLTPPSAPPSDAPSEAPAVIASPVEAAPPVVAAPPPEEPPTEPDYAAALGEGVTHHPLLQRTLGFYAVITPPGYDAPENRSKRYPIAVILHGSGSHELRHGVLANDIGREGVVYVVPRAPYPHYGAFLEVKRHGWTAWPTLPEAWGKRGSAHFPTSDMEKVELSKMYTDWIAACIRDARQRHRTDQNKVVIVGHSQGAAFAHLFAVRHPELVRALFSYAGYFGETLGNEATTRAHARKLKSSKITAMYVHHEGDGVVKVDETKNLSAAFEKAGVEHTTLLLPGGDHTMDDRVRDEARRFVRRHCCGQEVPTATPDPATDNVEATENAASTPTPAP